MHQRQNLNTPCFNNSKKNSMESPKRFQLSKIVQVESQNSKPAKVETLNESFGSESGSKSSSSPSRGRSGLNGIRIYPTRAHRANKLDKLVQLNIIGSKDPLDKASQ